MWSRCPIRTVSLLLVMMTWLASKVAMHPASQSFPMEIKELCVSPGIMWAVWASVGSCGMLSLHSSFVDANMVPLGRHTMMGVVVFPVLMRGSVCRI